MKRWVLAVMLAVMPAMGQQAQQDPNEEIQKIVRLQYAEPHAIRQLMRVFGVNVVDDSRMKVVVLSGPRRKVTTAEDAIKQLDVPSAAQKDIELTVFFVVGENPEPPNQPPHPSFGAIPSDLQSTVATLKSTFPFKTYYLLDALSLRARSGMRASTTGQLSGGRYTTFSVESANLEGDGTVIRLDNLYAGLQVPYTTEGKLAFKNTGLNTATVSVKTGQKLVVGRSSLDGPSKALFLVLIANIAKSDVVAEPLK